MEDRIFWFIFWAIILICIVVLTGFIVKVLIELAKDLKKLRSTIANANEISSYIVDGTKKASDIIDKTSSFPTKLFSYFLKRKKD
jgi:hypothetical protein